MAADRTHRIHLMLILMFISVLLSHFARCKESGLDLHKIKLGQISEGGAAEDQLCDLKILIACNNETLVGERGSIKFYHLSYAEYASNLNCKWTITVNSDKVIILYVEELDLEKGVDCRGGCDKLTIFDSDMTVLESFSNISLMQGTFMKSYETTSNTASVTFVSNGDENRGAGFTINYNAAQKEIKIMCGVPKFQPNVYKLELAPITVSPHSFPWHVNIFSETKKEIHTCSGTIIARDAIITAAHCFDSDLTGTTYKVSAGKQSLYEVEDSEMIFNVVGIFLHPNYDKNSLENDIAVVKLSPRITYTDAIRPVCLAGPQKELPTGSTCLTTWWPHNPGSDGRLDLTQSIITFQPMTLCNIQSETRRSSSICAGFNSSSLNVCNQRVTGGALVCQTGNQWIQYGVMSAGIGCSGPNSPAVFTNIGKYSDWISTQIGSECGRPAIAPKVFSRIVGGSEANPNSWPWQVSVRRNNLHVCGGSIIASRWILTAAHCFDEKSLRHPEEYTVAVGKHRLRLKDPMEKVYSVETAFRYPEQTEQFLEFDITLIYLAEDIVYSKYVKPVCLDVGVFRAGQKCVVTGWGNTQQIAPEADDDKPILMSDVLNELEVPLIDEQTCTNAVNRHNQVNFMSISPDLIVCAGYLDGSKDSCSGDSGGPLVCFDDSEGVWKQVGIVSYGRGCAVRDFPGFYAKLSEYYDWIKLQISSHPFPVNSGSQAKQSFDGR